MSNEVMVEIADGKGRVEGQCADQFRSVLHEFVANFRSRDEVGASVVVTHEGNVVADLWGGVSSLESQAPWDRDTVSLVFSASKGVTAIIANVLIDRGLLDPWQPVGEIWPEFATNGKEKTTVRMMLDHTAGVPVLRETIKEGGFYDWDYMCDLLARQAPYWEPGSQQGYHAVTFAWTAGELIRRVTGKSVGTNIQEILSEPLQLDLWCGLPESIEPRVSRIIPAVFEQNDNDEVFTIAQNDPESIPAQFIFNDGGWMTGITEDEASLPQWDTRESHAAEIPSVNAITNARGLAKAYRPLAIGGAFNGVRLVGPETLVGMEEISAGTGCDQTLRVRSAWSLGFAKRIDTRSRRSETPHPLVLGRRAFGHVGAGGSIGFADPAFGLSFGYSMNNQGATLSLTDRGQSLVDAAYRALGCTNNGSGYWTQN